MTFYEAALRVLEEAGMPLHSTDITKRAVEKGLLSHVGKTPEITMLSRLAGMAKRQRDRKLQVTSRDTFALTDWMLPEDPEALAQTGLIEPHPEESLPPYRPAERHPEAHAEFLRSIGRQSDRKRRDDDRKKKYPPVAEVAFETLQEAQTALVASELLARLKAREGVADDLSVGRLLEGLAQDNQKRLDEGRRPQFAAIRTEANELQLSLETQAEGGPSPLEVQQTFCAACQLPFEGGRVILRRGGERPQSTESVPAVGGPSTDDVALLQSLRHAAKDARRAMARVLRKKLVELELRTFEKCCVRMLHALHYRELKVIRRSKEGLLMMARRREGSLEIRYAVRLLKANQVERRHVQELRRDLQSHGANMGLLLTTGDARGDARGECTSGALVMLWAGEALAEKFFEAKVGVSVATLETFEIDEAFFVQAKADAEESMRRREERHRDRNERAPAAEAAPVADHGAPAPSAPEAVAAPVEGVAEADGDSDADEAGSDEEGDDSAGGVSTEGPQEPGAAGEGRRRRRRRRRRRGGVRPPGAPGEGGVVAATAGAGASESQEASVSPLVAVPAEPASSAPVMAPPPAPDPAPTS